MRDNTKHVYFLFVDQNKGKQLITNSSFQNTRNLYSVMTVRPMITNITVQTLSMSPTRRSKQLYVMNLVQSGFESHDQVYIFKNKFV